MDKRKQKRVRARILVKIDGKSGILSDFSEEGVQISTNSPPSKKEVDIIFSASGKEIFVKGMIQWIKKKYSVQNAFQIGCQVENPPVEYLNFLLNH
jgi:hypothetical protein